MSLKFNSHDAFYDQKRPLQAQTSKYRVSIRLLYQKEEKKYPEILPAILLISNIFHQYGCIISNVANNVVGNIAESAIFLAMLSAILVAILLNYQQYC